MAPTIVTDPSLEAHHVTASGLWRPETISEHLSRSSSKDGALSRKSKSHSPRGGGSRNSPKGAGASSAPQQLTSPRNVLNRPVVRLDQSPPSVHLGRELAKEPSRAEVRLAGSPAARERAVLEAEKFRDGPSHKRVLVVTTHLKAGDTDPDLEQRRAVQIHATMNKVEEYKEAYERVTGRKLDGVILSADLNADAYATQTGGPPVVIGALRESGWESVYDLPNRAGEVKTTGPKEGAVAKGKR